jgi:hypothetical protein
MKPELLAVFLQFLKDYPKPTKKDLKQLLPQVNMGEKEVRAFTALLVEVLLRLLTRVCNCSTLP